VLDKLPRPLTVATAVATTLVAFAALSAFAATVGGLGSTWLGADQSIVASCSTSGVGVAYTNVYNAATSTEQITAVTLSGVNPACNAKAFQLTLTSGVTSLGQTSGTIALTAAGSQTVTLTAPVTASAVTGVGLVITN
jgi:hypothetical protein